MIHVERLVPIDAKFPLDNFERLADAETDEERVLHEKAFARDLRNHVDAIATKYIRPDEGTYDFALMYLLSEGVYYELVCGKTGAMLKYAHEKRVFPVSPTTFTSQLQVISLGLKGMQIEQRAHEVMAYVAQLQGDFDWASETTFRSSASTSATRSPSTRTPRSGWIASTPSSSVAAETEEAEVQMAEELPRALDAWVDQDRPDGRGRLSPLDA